MSAFDWLRSIHITCAVLSIGGFALRGAWRLSGNTLLQQPVARVAPHIVDTLLLCSAIGMLVIWGTSPLQMPWVMAKIAALLAHIGLGMITLRFGRTPRVRRTAYVMALLVAGYIVSVALTHSVLGPLSPARV
jgi:uncharacterized membrane protein SirB2